MGKTIGSGIQEFDEIRENNYFYIDKTSFIKEWWESGDKVTLIARPRHFGKTLNMNSEKKEEVRRWYDGFIFGKQKDMFQRMVRGWFKGTKAQYNAFIKALLQNDVKGMNHYITVMVQKEVAQRMQAAPGTKDYGALSLAVQYYAEPYIVANVPPNCFMPRPAVGSAVIRLKRHAEPPVEVKDEKLMFRLIRASFNQRRKHF